MNREEVEELVQTVGNAAFSAGMIHGALSVLVMLEQNPELARQMLQSFS